MTAQQIDQVRTTREFAWLVDIRAPVNGFVLARNVSNGQRFEPSTELYTIADLSRVWILADAFEGDAQHFKPGMRVTVSQPVLGKVLAARVSPYCPSSIRPPARSRCGSRPTTRLVLRPDMFVDVEMLVELGRRSRCPRMRDRLGDASRRPCQGDGSSSPQVKTGSRATGRDRSGLAEGEGRHLGQLLLDSESRMRAAGLRRRRRRGSRHGQAQAAAAPVAAAATEKDPICGMTVDTAEAKAAGRTSTYEGSTHYFCAPGCKEAFDKDPAAHIKPRT
jgi:Cu(I)/Ag(I) efflux system membrane fusion protein